MMIIFQKRQTVTRRNTSYVAELFDRLMGNNGVFLDIGAY